jgi:predicted nuclease with TOPRIM domain
LRNDLKVRDLEYEQVRNRLEKLEAQNTFLAEKLKEEKQHKQTIEAKLNKITYMKELDANFAAINNNAFFGAKSKQTYNASQQTKLIDSVNEQYKSSLKNSAAAKCAHIWLEKVRRKRLENQNNNLFNKL